MTTLTTVNSSLTLTINNLYDFPQTIQGYAVDDAFSSDDVDTVQVAMGVDRKLSFGYVPVERKLNIMLQANSASADIFDNLANAQDAIGEVYTVTATIILPSLGNVYVFTNGAMTNYSPMPSSKKILQQRKFSFTFERLTWSRI
jgi:hypothetical protein